ncbi:hypothetical protein H9660_08750 [Clostridium sp. Sa3CUN1]|uniref:Phage-related protein n=1 Tax=Clostridium gallinarum TaxID=2762246 RepID=A0ABR8Q4I7_9CLOT|nr:hypothetical protein [Clostridium gallinarum]MBD7915234.1 hypothetical protein [Clostridium gallinarum]
MSDSVGKIGLELEIVSDIKNQVSKVSDSLKASLKKNLQNTMSKSLDNVTKETKNKLNGVSKTISSSISKTLNNTVKSLKNILKNISIPKMELPRASKNITSKNSILKESMGKRGPPINYDVVTAQIENVTAALENTNAKIEQQQSKLIQLRESYRNTFNISKKNKIQEQILKTESSIIKLTGQSDKLGFKLADLDGKLASLENKSASTGKKLGFINNSTSKASNITKKYSYGLGSTIGQMFKWMIILPMIVNGLKAMTTGLYNNLMTNEQFSNSLAQIKSNLMIAFTPIYEAILPAINALMSALSVATQYIASFISAIFGKTFEQSKQATQGLIDAKNAMGVYGDSAKAAGEAAKDALGLASFDEINTLNSNNDSSGSNGGGGSSSIPQLVTPALDTSSVDSAMKSLVDKIKAYINTFNFEPLINSFNRLKKSVEPIINNLGKIIKWFLVEILDPLAHWTISDLLPAFINLIAGALDFLNPILEVFMSLGAWLWDSFLQPIASWTGGVIVDVLNGLADMLSNIGAWISEHKPLIEDLVLVIGSFALAWGLVNAAIGLWNSVGVIATAVTTVFGAAMTAVNWPLLIVVAAIGAVIAIGILLYKHWDEIKAKAIEIWDKVKEKVSEFCDKAKEKFNDFKVKVSEIWDGIKLKFNDFKTWLGNVFATDWSQRFGFLGDILNGYLTNVKNIFDSVKQIFKGIIDFIAGVFTGNWSRAWQGVKDIFSGIMNGLEAVMKAPLNGIIGLINAAISGLNKIKIPSIDIPFFGEVGGWGFNIPKIPYLAKGGIIDSPTLAMVGEAGKEAVVPLENNTQGLDLLASKLMERLGGMNKSNNFNSDRPIEITLKVGDTVFGTKAIESINKVQRMAGKTLLRI